MILRIRIAGAVMSALLLLSACGPKDGSPRDATDARPATQEPPESLPMGGAKSVTSFFVTSTGPGKGGDLGGLSGADAHCQALAKAEGSGDHTFRAYLSTAATANQPAVNARDRIGNGPWYNALGDRVAANLEQLHGNNAINNVNAVTERGDTVSGVGDTPNRHDIVTGSQGDGTAFSGPDDLTCGNWTSSTGGRAQVGHHDRQGQGQGATSWNSAHPSNGCSQRALESTGGAGLFYCFAID
jgi:hypothetical protein